MMSKKLIKANMSTYTIDLEKYRSIDKQTKYKSKVFTGRDRGKDVREESRLDELEATYDSIVVSIPEDIYSINPSFFEELFRDVVKKLGREGFLGKFTFESKGDYDFQDELMEAIDRILNSSTAIG